MWAKSGEYVGCGSNSKRSSFTVHCLGGTVVIQLPYGAVFAWLRRPNNQIILCSIHYWSFFLSGGSQWTKFREYSRKLMSKPCLLTYGLLAFLDAVYRVQSILLIADLTQEWSGGSTVTYRLKKSALLRLKMTKRASELSIRLCFLFAVNMRGTRFANNFFICK